MLEVHFKPYWREARIDASLVIKRVLVRTRECILTAAIESKFISQKCHFPHFTSPSLVLGSHHVTKIRVSRTAGSWFTVNNTKRIEKYGNQFLKRRASLSSSSRLEKNGKIWRHLVVSRTYCMQVGCTTPSWNPDIERNLTLSPKICFNDAQEP